MSRATWRTHDRPLKYRAIEPALFAGLQGEDEEDALAERVVARAMATSPAPRRPASDVHSLRGQNGISELAREQNPAESPTETAPTPEGEPAARPKRIREKHPGLRLPADLPREEQRRRPEPRTDGLQRVRQGAGHDQRGEERTPRVGTGHFQVIVEVREVLACSCGDSKPVTGTRALSGAIFGRERATTNPLWSGDGAVR